MAITRIVALSAVAAALACPAAASASTRHVSPTGFGAACSTMSPCTLAQGIFGAVDGDEVLLASGTYDVTQSPELDISHKITLRGDPSAPRPVVVDSGTGAVVSVTTAGGAGTTVQHVELHGTPGGASTGVWSAFPLTVTDVEAETDTACARFAGATTITDSTFRQIVNPGQNYACLSVEGDGSRVSHTSVDSFTEALYVSGGDVQLSDLVARASVSDGLFYAPGPAAAPLLVSRSTFTGAYTGIRSYGSMIVTDSVATASKGSGIEEIRGTAHLRNVTAIGTTGAVQADAEQNAATTRGTIEARSIIAVGGAGVVAQKGGTKASCTIPGTCADGVVTIDHSLFSAADPRVTDGGDNKTSDPKFVDAAGGDLHLNAGSPAIDAGAADALTGTYDRDGKARVQGSAVDAGAFETVAVAPAPGDGTDPGAGNDAPGGTTGGGTPVPPAGGGGDQKPPLTDSTAPAIGGLRVTRRGLRYKLSEPAVLKVVIQRVVRGKSRPAKVATLTLRGKQGANATKFSKRVAKRLHRRGNYRVTVIATDAAGNRSKAKAARYRVVR